MFVPFIKESDRSISGLGIHTTNKNTGESRFLFVPRNFVKDYPLKENIFVNTNGNYTNMSREYLVGAFTGIEQSLFDNVSHDLYLLLPKFNQLQFRDCIIKTLYEVTTCWAMFGGGEFQGIECSTSYEIETTQCSGANTSNTTGTGGPSIVIGGGSSTASTGTTSGSTPTNRDPCAEDGINCPDDETIDIDEILIRLLAGLNQPQNNIDPDAYPCAHAVTQRVLSNPSTTLNDMVQELLGLQSTVSITVNVNSNVLSGGTRNGVTSWARDRNTGAFSADIYLNPTHMNCSEDRVFATLYHEILHAYIGGLWEDALNEETSYSVFDFNNQFSIFTSIPNGGQVDSHEIMANHFLTQLTLAIRGNNPTLDPDVARNLALGGLEDTDYFRERLSSSEQEEVRRVVGHSRCQENLPGNRNLMNFVDCD